jgi:hypothetical protein
MGWKKPPKSGHTIKHCITWWPNKFPMWNMTMGIHVISGIFWNVGMIGMIMKITVQSTKGEECI